MAYRPVRARRGRKAGLAEDRPAETWSAPLATSYLIDTQVLIWLLSDPDRLRADIRAVLADPRTVVQTSLASVWEIVIKVAIGKLDPGTPATALPQAIAAIGVDVLGIAIEHVLAVAALPLHHRDPFDRLIIAQAIAENAMIVSSDDAFARYPVRVLAV